MKKDQTYIQAETVLKEQLLVDDIDPGTDLFDEGYLDSMSLINLMMALELEFSILIEPEDLNMDDYHTLYTITAMLRRLTNR